MNFDLRELSGTFSVADVVAAMALSLILSTVIGYVYRYTHRDVSYSQSCVQTLVIVGMIVALIMLVVGSSLARAFSLVGALSLVRFRNAVKETRDVGFIFPAMAIGMACGARFYTLAAVAVVICAVVNACTHTPVGTTRIPVTRSPDSGPPLTSGAPACVIEVADNGSGIEPHDAPHVFERFYRATPRGRRGPGAGPGPDPGSDPGSGLGLAIATAIATAHGGRLEPDNRPGEGCTFRPLLPDPALAPRDDTGEGHGSGVRNERLLRRDTRGSGSPSPTPRPPRPGADRVRRRRPW
ncbi:ATP-binding protein [Streptomyces sp. NPDC048161]|uniref:ATP-binding protein n=1 Tax=Streptomyces sp. NPDC048161 TaxID=3160985 RepID=UPI0033CD6226